MLLKIAAINVRRQFVVAREEKVQRIGFVIRYRSGSHRRVVRSERMSGHHVETERGMDDVKYRSKKAELNM